MNAFNVAHGFACKANAPGSTTAAERRDRPWQAGIENHLATDRNGLPLSLGISGAHMHDSLGLEPLVRGRRGVVPDELLSHGT